MCVSDIFEGGSTAPSFRKGRTFGTASEDTKTL